MSVDSLNLDHRVVLSAMTRIRADENTLAPTGLTAQYYSQRAGSGRLSDYADNLSELPTPQNVKYREIYKGMMIGAGGFSPNSAKEAIYNQ